MPRLNGLSCGRQNKESTSTRECFWLSSVHGAFATQFKCNIFIFISPCQYMRLTLHQSRRLRELHHVVIEFKLKYDFEVVDKSYSDGFHSTCVPLRFVNKGLMIDAPPPFELPLRGRCKVVRQTLHCLCGLYLQSTRQLHFSSIPRAMESFCNNNYKCTDFIQFHVADHCSKFTTHSVIRWI